MKLFKNFVNSFYVHFGYHKNSETITSVSEILSQNPKHILIIQIDEVSEKIISDCLTQFDFLRQTDLLEFEDFQKIKLTDNFEELKGKLSTIKNHKFYDTSVTLTENHREFKKEIEKIRNICLLSRPTFTVLRINIPENLKTERHIEYLNEKLLIFKDKVRDTSTFIIMHNEQKSKLLFVSSPKTPNIKDSPITNSRYDTGVIGWISFVVLFGLIVILILFKFY